MIKKFLYKCKRWLLSIHLDVHATHHSWPARLEVYAVIFGKIRLKENITPNGFPTHIRIVDEKAVDAEELKRIVMNYRIHKVNIRYGKWISMHHKKDDKLNTRE
jgi:hypothetical protein